MQAQRVVALTRKETINKAKERFEANVGIGDWGRQMEYQIKPNSV
jgi:hypothetical protein